MKYTKTFILDFFRRILSAALILTFSSCAFCACGETDSKSSIGETSYSSENTTKTEATTGGTLRIPVNLSPSTLHPLYIAEAQLRNVYSIIFEPLIELDENSEPSPCIAESWSYYNGDWTIKLRTNVHWHGGLGEITAQDAAFTINSILSDSDSIYYSNLSTYASGAEGYDTTLTIHAKTPSYALIYALNIPVIPESYYSEIDKNTMAVPRGSGCFSVDKLDLTNGFKLSLSAFSKWWKKLPYIENVEAIGYSSTEAMLDAFSKGELDCIPASIKTTEKYEILSGVNEQNYLSHNYVFLGFNTNRAITGNAEFRKAIAYAIDRTEIINNVYLSKGSGAEQPLFNDSSLSSTAVTMYDHNTTKTSEILNSLGYTDSDGNGYVELDGNEIVLTIAVIDIPENPIRLEAAECICSQLKEVGINAAVTAYTEDELKKAVSDGSYDLVLSGYYLSDTPNLRFSFGDGSGNLSSYSSVNILSALDEMDNSETLTELKSAALMLQNAVANELPHIGLLFEMNTFLYSDKLHISSIRRESSVYAQINLWWLEY